MTILLTSNERDELETEMAHEACDAVRWCDHTPVVRELLAEAEEASMRITEEEEVETHLEEERALFNEFEEEVLLDYLADCDASATVH